MKSILVLLLLSLISFSPIDMVQAQPGSSFEPIEDYDYIRKRRFNIFTNTIVYGVFAGMAVGLAVSTDLEFDLNAELNLRHVARGASYGLYFGVLVGTWFAYSAENQSTGSDENLDQYYEEEVIFHMTPRFRDGSPEGLSVHANLVSF